MQKYVSYIEWKSRYSSFIACAIPLPPSLSLSVTLQRGNGESAAESVLCATVCEVESVVSVQRAFRPQFQSDPPAAKNISRLYQQYQTKGCVRKRENAGSPRVSEESVERMRASFLRSPKKSVRHASREMEMSTMTVWRVLRKRLEIKPYRLHLAICL
jgi:hypothetical protein